MSKKLTIISLILTLAILYGIGIYLHEDGTPVMGNADYFLKQDDIPMLEKNAKNGDIKAARRLALYYGFVALDSRKEAEWLTYAATRGDIWAQYNLGMLYCYDSEVADVEKGKFWLEKAADAGDEKAKDELKALLANSQKIK